MTTNIRDLEFLRNQMLLLIEAIGGTGIKPDTLHLQLQANGFPGIDEDTLERNLEYLTGKRLIEARRAVLSKGTVRYAVTADGIDYLEEKGLL